MINLGDIIEDAIVDFMWDTNDGSGGSITRATDGTVSVYKANGTTQSVAGVTDTEDFDSLTGVHHCRIDTSADAFYAVGNDYMVVLSAATIDGQTVNHVLAYFSIENRGGAIANAVWDAPLTGSSHNDPTSAGRRLRQLAGNIYTDGTAQAGGVNTITLAAGESATDNIFRQSYVAIVGGTGVNQGHHILQYNGTSKVAVIDDDWVVQPDATSEYIVYGSGSHDEIGEGQAQAGAASTITLSSSASAIDDTYNKAWISIVSGTGVGQARRISDYIGATKVATVSEAWTTNPDATSGYFIRANAEVEKAVWDEKLTGATHNIEDSAGRRLRNLQEFGSYEGGAVFIDTVDGSAGTTNYENGTNLKPVDNIADATTLAIALNLKIFHVVTGSTITLAQTYNNYLFKGHGWTLALGGQDVAGTHVEGPAGVTGIGTGAGEVEFHDCHIGNVTLNETHFEACGFSGTVTMAAATDYEVTNGYSTDNNTPVFDFGVGVANADLNLTGWHGKVELQNMGQTGADVANIYGQGDVTINVNCVGGTVNLNSKLELINNGSGQTVNVDTVDVGKISGSSDAADRLEASVETVVPGAAIAGTLSTTEMTTDLIEATDNHYNGRSIVFTSGSLKDQASAVEGYDGMTKKLTFIALTEAPGIGDTFVLV